MISIVLSANTVFYTKSDSISLSSYISTEIGGGRVVRWCWAIFQCRGVLLIWIRVGQGLTVLAVGAGGGCLDIFSLIYHFSILSPSLWETARYRLKYCLKGPLSPKQPTNQLQQKFLGQIKTIRLFIQTKKNLFPPILTLQTMEKSTELCS